MYISSRRVHHTQSAHAARTRRVAPRNAIDRPRCFCFGRLCRSPIGGCNNGCWTLSLNLVVLTTRAPHLWPHTKQNQASQSLVDRFTVTGCRVVAFELLGACHAGPPWLVLDDGQAKHKEGQQPKPSLLRAIGLTGVPTHPTTETNQPASRSIMKLLLPLALLGGLGLVNAVVRTVSCVLKQCGAQTRNITLVHARAHTHTAAAVPDLWRRQARG